MGRGVRPNNLAEIAELRVRWQGAPDSVETLTAVAQRFLELGAMDEATGPLARLLDVAPDTAWACDSLGLAYVHEGKMHDAIECFRRALKIEPKSRDTWHNLALAELQSGKADEAINALQELIALDPNDARVHHDLAIAFEVAAQQDDASREFEKTVELNPWFTLGRWNSLRHHFERGNVEVGRRTLESIKSRYPLVPDSRPWESIFAADVLLRDRASTDVQSFTGTEKLTGKKLVFFAQSAAFLGPIMEYFRNSNQVVLCQSNSQSEIRDRMEWADLAWFEWCDDLVAIGSRLPKSCKIVCRLHSYEAFTEMPAHVDWSKIDRLILVNSTVGDVLDRFTSGISVPRSVIGNGVDPDRFPLADRGRTGGNVAFVGYINYKKGPSLLLQCFKSLQEFDPMLRFHIAGEHQDPRILVYLEDMLPKLGLSVTMHGWTRDMPSFYQSMDYVISTSLFESFHYSVAEGMLSGCLPLIHTWQGAERLYPEECLFRTISECVDLTKNYQGSDVRGRQERYRRWVIDRHNLADRLLETEHVLAELLESDQRREGRRTTHPLVARDVKKADDDRGLVTVVIPTYNRSEYLGEAIESALCQSYPNIEIVVCDDGSTDDTPELLRSYGERVRVIRQVNRGPAAALNSAIRQARGEYIAWLSDDDAFCPTKIEEQVQLLSQDHSVGLVYSDVNFVNEFSDVLGRANIKPPSDDNDPARLLETNWINGCSVMFRRSAIDGIAWFDEELGEKPGYGIDGLLWVQLLKHHRAAFIDKPLVYYRVHPTNTTKSIDTKKGWERFRNSASRWLEAVNRFEKKDFNVLTPKHNDPDSHQSPEKNGLKVVWVGAVDPGGVAAMYASALNRYTEHSCRVLVHNNKLGFDSDLVIRPTTGHDSAQAGPRSTQQVLKEAELSVAEADVIVFTAGVGPGANREDMRVKDTDEEPFGTIDWPSALSGKSCLAFLPGSPSVRANVHWYAEHLTAKGWPILTCHGDLHLHIPGATYVPMLLDRNSKRYDREIADGGTPVLLLPSGDGRTSGKECAERIALKLQAQNPELKLGRANGMNFAESLSLKRHAHVAIDRLSAGTGHFGLASLEHSALGLINVVSLSEYERALLAMALGTDELPWLTSYDEETLYSQLRELLEDHNRLTGEMVRTREWFQRYWDERVLVGHLANAITETTGRDDVQDRAAIPELQLQNA